MHGGQARQQRHTLEIESIRTQGGAVPPLRPMHRGGRFGTGNGWSAPHLRPTREFASTHDECGTMLKVVRRSVAWRASVSSTTPRRTAAGKVTTSQAQTPAHGPTSAFNASAPERKSAA